MKQCKHERDCKDVLNLMKVKIKINSIEYQIKNKCYGIEIIY